TTQIRRIGASCDWTRERFTLDEGLSKAVRKVFVDLYKEGLIYQGYRIINWCPRCRTALSDIETEYEELSGALYYIRYPFKENQGYITVATTRPETMLGDTAVAVNPTDERYNRFVGKMLVLPLVNREIPIIADGFVSKEFGTGLVKVTPAHDPNDFEIAMRHNLPEIVVLDERGYINENGGKYCGLERFEARKKIIEDLKAQGLLEKIEDHHHAVGHCYRCHTIIEPYMSKQWFVKVKPLAEEAIRAVEDGRIRFVPRHWEKTYFEWMHNIRDWCISRQLWWGHRIPAFYCDSCGHITVALDDPSQCEKCNSRALRQDEDVLDTWFSSALWPFSTMGWPEMTDTLKKYYPTSVLVTGFDIIFFWVARMIMMGLKFMKDVPFRDVYIHALVRDEHGQKMSKSRGNVIDPLVVMEKYGTDAFRFTLAIFAAQGRDIILSEKRIEGYRAFCNKIWNAVRFILMNVGNGFVPHPLNIEKLEQFDRWILHRLNDTIATVTSSLEEYRFNDAAQAIYEFWWHEFCDWYVEMVKNRLYGDSSSESAETARQVLYYVLKNAAKILHPFMPFITEEIWEKIKQEGETRIIREGWPTSDARFYFEKDVHQTEIFKEIVYKIRNIRGELNVSPAKKANVVFCPKSDYIIEILRNTEKYIQLLAKVENISIDPNYKPAKSDASAILSDCEIYVPLEGLIDIAKERERLEKEIGRIKAELGKILAKLNNRDFVEKAPVEVVEKEKSRQSELSAVLGALEERHARLQDL
ncbi:MAG: valine--tRNA ligase, partial [Spirochaetes bacterium]|nr:valine--tRNA ligase [Spirochaetota bacterium]